MGIVRPAFTAGDRNQCLLCDNGTDTPYVVRTIKDDTINYPPNYTAPANTQFVVYYLPQKAVAIVTGTVP